MRKQNHFLRFLAHELKKNKFIFFIFLVFIFLCCVSLFAEFFAPHDPYDLNTIDLLNAEIPPVWQADGDKTFLLGTDEQGRGILSTMIYGTRISLFIGLFAVALQMVLGIIIGLLAGYKGGLLDNIFMRIADIQLSFSTMLVAIIFLAIFQSIYGQEFYEEFALFMIISVIGLAEWPQFARTIRSNVLAEKKKEYVQATQIMGFNQWRIMFIHILPNCFSSILVIGTIQVASAIISEAALSFLGLGMPVTQPSLGSLISNGFKYVYSGSWWITILPGVFLIVIVFSINLLGDWLRETLNPKIYN